MEEYRYKKEYKYLKERTILRPGYIYRIRYLGRYVYEVYSRDQDIKLCTITQKMLNHFFEKVS